MSTESNSNKVILPGGAVRGSRTHLLAKMGIMLAIAVVFSFIPSFPMLPGVDFIRYEFSDIPLLISGFAFGAPAGIVLVVLADVLNFFLGGAESGPYGMIMHVLAIGSFVLVSSLIYRRHKDRKHAIIGLVAGILAMTVIMVPANLIITPLFMGVPVEFVKPLIPTAIIPVNLMKATLSAALTFILYKRVSPFLHK
ncbi:MAG: ECF transporter S component [Clostridiales Family XIII bacterium]|nr:ECF transporter S component [Clostridiales Family XIII bacterium]